MDPPGRRLPLVFSNDKSARGGKDELVDEDASAEVEEQTLISSLKSRSSEIDDDARADLCLEDGNNGITAYGRNTEKPAAVPMTLTPRTEIMGEEQPKGRSGTIWQARKRFSARKKKSDNPNDDPSFSSPSFTRRGLSHLFVSNLRGRRCSIGSTLKSPESSERSLCTRRCHQRGLRHTHASAATHQQNDKSAMDSSQEFCLVSPAELKSELNGLHSSWPQHTARGADLTPGAVAVGGDGSIDNHNCSMNHSPDSLAKSSSRRTSDNPLQELPVAVTVIDDEHKQQQLQTLQQLMTLKDARILSMEQALQELQGILENAVVAEPKLPDSVVVEDEGFTSGLLSDGEKFAMQVLLGEVK